MMFRSLKTFKTMIGNELGPSVDQIQRKMKEPNITPYGRINRKPYDRNKH